MTEVTGGVQDYTPEVSEAERRRRLAAIYRRLIKLAQKRHSPDILSEEDIGVPTSPLGFDQLRH